MTPRLRSLAAPLASAGLLALAFVACSSSSTKLSMSARTGSAAAAAAAPGARAQALAAGGGVNLTRVRMVVEQIKLEPAADGGSGGGTSDGGVSGEDVIAGPYLIDLSGTALESGLTQVFDVDAVPGTYDQIKFKIHKLGGGDPQFPEMSGLSIKLDGTFNGATFTWTSTLDEEQEREGTFVITADSANNVTLAIDTSGWFVDRNGAAIDPNDESKRSIVEGNVKSSIDAFDDDNRDGHR